MLDLSRPALATSGQPPPYQHAVVESRWQQAWQAARVFEVPDRPERPKWFIVELPPFATGQLHMGHARNYVLADAGARFRRMLGHDVLYTSGFDTFGLPTELAARADGANPLELAERCSADMSRQFVRLGLGHDRRRITAYHVPEYYRWVQWVFLRLFEGGHCFRREATANWCPQCQIALAASLVEEGRCWRCKSKVQARMLPQWFVRESDFADSMLEGMDSLAGWSDTVKKIHRDWIGRRAAVRLMFPLRSVHGSLEEATNLTVVLTHEQPIADLRFIAIGRDHPLARTALDSADGLPVRLTHTAEGLSPHGVPVQLPVFVEDVIGDGTRGGMEVLDDTMLAPAGCGLEAMSSAGLAERCVEYRLQDWNIARNRYWGPPVPIVHCSHCGPVAVPDADLPVLLPVDVDLSSPGNPLEVHDGFRRTKCPRCGASARRDTETLEAYSSPWWYHWICKGLTREDPFDREDARSWLPVDLMIGGNDQIRSCFFHVRMMARALRRMDITEIDEPVDFLLALGMVKQDNRKMSKSSGNAVDLDAVIAQHGADALRLAILSAAAPESDFNWSDALVRRQRAFLSSVWAFVHRVSAALTPAAGADSAADPDPQSDRVQTWLSSADRRISANLRGHDYHLAVKNIEFLFERLQTHEKAATKGGGPLKHRDARVLHDAMQRFVLYLAPLAPHMAEELWRFLGGAGLVAAAAWPGAESRVGVTDASPTGQTLSQGEIA